MALRIATLSALVVGSLGHVLRGGMPEEFVPTPGGYRHKSCLHRLPEGHEIERDAEDRIHFTKNKVRVFEVPECPHPTLPASGGNGWQAWTWDKRMNADWTKFNGNFSVPDAPNYAGQLLYIFTGLQDSCCGLGVCTNQAKATPGSAPSNPNAACDIIQPVLQYGTGPAGGGTFWSITNWYITGTRYIYTDCKQVRASTSATPNTVQGDMYYMSNGSFALSFNDQNGVSSSMVLYGQIPVPVPQHVAYCTLETYGATCGAYPKMPIKFTKMTGSLKAGGFKGFEWTPTYKYDNCGQKAVVKDQDVTIEW